MGQSVRLPLSFLLGALLGLSTPGFDLSFLAWFALAPLLILVRSCRGGLSAALTGLVFGAGYYAVSLSFFAGLLPLRWMQLPDLVGYQVVLFTWVLETLHNGLLFAAFALLAYLLPTRPGFLPHIRRPYFPYLLSIPVIWVFLMWVVATSPIFMGMPITQLAYSQSRNLPLIQLASLGGSGMIDFLLVMANAACAEIFIEGTSLVRGMGHRADQINNKAGIVFDLVIVALLTVVSVNYGQARINNIVEATRPEKAQRLTPQCPPVSVAVIQGNVSIEEERFKTIPEEELVVRYNELARGLGANILVLPEGVVTAGQRGQALLSELKGIESAEKKEIIYGTVEPGKEGYSNCGRILSSFNLPGSVYTKQKLVPFGESIPINLVYQKIPESLREKIPASKERFLEAKSAQLVASGFGNVGVSICNELVYPKLIGDEVRKGATLLVCLANLSWFHNSSLNKQFLACATLRAVENKRFMILATNTGVSSVIDPIGMTVTRSFALKRGILLDTVQFIYSRTPYNRMHWL